MLRLTLISLGYFLAVFWIAGCGGAGSVESPKPPSAEQVTVPSLSEAKNTGDYWNANGLKMPFRWCSAGSYSMGLSESEKDPIDALDNTNDPVHVQLTGFWLGEREVTQAEWKAVMGSTVEEQRAKAAAERLWGVGDRFPIYFVTWRESSEFCRRLTQSERAAGRLPEGWIYALPTEAQWEYACRAGTTTLTNLGDSVGSDRINYSPDHSFPGAAPGPHRNSTVEVGSLPANAWGFHEMHGNVMEWCRGSHLDEPEGGEDPFYEGDPDEDRVVRGGSWLHAARLSRSGARMYNDPEARYNDLGLRVAIVRAK